MFPHPDTVTRIHDIERTLALKRAEATAHLIGDTVNHSLLGHRRRDSRATVISQAGGAIIRRLAALIGRPAAAATNA